MIPTNITISNKLVYLQNNVVVFAVKTSARKAGIETNNPAPTIIDITNNPQVEDINLNWLYDEKTGTFSAPVPVPPPIA